MSFSQKTATEKKNVSMKWEKFQVLNESVINLALKKGLTNYFKKMKVGILFHFFFFYFTVKKKKEGIKK